MILSAGRRGLLVSYFREELRRLEPMAKLVAADMDPQWSAACHLADVFVQTPSARDSNFIEQLLETCLERRVRLVIPTIDTELLPLSRNRERFEAAGIQVVVSGHELTTRCRDKRLTAEVFAAGGVRVPAEVDPNDERSYPLVAKPRDGSSSQNLHIAYLRHDLPNTAFDDANMIFQEFLAPEEHDEYTVDMYYDRSGKLRCFVPRLRVATRAGEVSKAKTARIDALQLLGDRFATLPGAAGCLTMQVFVRRVDKSLIGIEINPRFGGGYPLSYEAGANYPRWVLGEYLRDDEIPWFDGWQDGLAMLRYDAHVLIPSAA